MTKAPALTALLTLVFAVNSATAQESRGSIRGKVLDPQGAVVADAVLTVISTDTNAVRRTMTNATGYFEVTLLNPGTYSITIEASGFKKAVRSGLVLSVAGRMDLTFSLDVGAV